MNSRLFKQFSRLEDTRKQLLEKLGNVDVKRLNTPPAAGKWSAAQVIYHLNKAEYFSVSYVSKKMLDVNNLKKTGMKEWLKTLLLKVAFISPLKFNAPVKVLGKMPDNVDYTDIVAQWDETRKKLHHLLESLPGDILVKNVFKQPAAGRLNIYQMLDFMQAHFNRHEKQIIKAIHKK